LRQPLAAALSAREVIAGSREEADRQSAALIIEHQLRHLSRLVEDLMDISHISRGTLVIRSQQIDLRAVVQDAIEMTRPMIEKGKHVLTVSLGGEALWANGDAARLQQVFSNLLQNAAAYTPPGGRIDLALKRQRAEAVFRVRDNGTGIEPGLLPHLFDAFYRGSDENRSGSLGVGLAIVRQIVELHGGSVRAASRGRNLGSEFMVRLPAVASGQRQTSGSGID
jgi:signal transduction histidine kinase